MSVNTTTGVVPRFLGDGEKELINTYLVQTHIIFIVSSQDDLLAELEEMEQEELEKDLLEVETPSEPLDDSIAELPEVRKLNLNRPA